MVDDVLAAELEAFEEVGTGAKIEYTRPNRAAEGLGRYPARALALLMANQFTAGRTTESGDF